MAFYGYLMNHKLALFFLYTSIESISFIHHFNTIRKSVTIINIVFNFFFDIYLFLFTKFIKLTLLFFKYDFQYIFVFIFKSISFFMR